MAHDDIQPAQPPTDRRELSVSGSWPITLAGLLSAASVLLWISRWLRPSTWPAVFLEAALSVGAAWVVSAAAIGLARAIRRRQTRSEAPLWPPPDPVLAIWLAPLILLLRSNSLSAALPAAALAAAMTKLLRGQPPNEPDQSSADPGPDPFFATSLPSPAPRRFPALAAAISFQTACVYASASYALHATGLFALTAALVTTARIASGAARPNDVSRPRRSLVILAALFLTVLSLMRHLPGQPGFGIPSMTAQASRPAPRRVPSDRPPDASRPDDESVDVTHIGVILYPEEQKHITLVPPLPAGSASLFPEKRNPLSIPFYGAYWFFRPPDRRPPRHSLVTHGNPTNLKLRSTGRIPLNMEARQNLGTLLDLNCCSRIEIAVQNADPYPSSVALQLDLINTTLPGQPEQSLGTAFITSTSGGLPPGDEHPPTPETLRFEIPTAPVIRQFDEFRIIFRMSHVRSDRSAMISIERFVLVPRGYNAGK